jgi:hypothetical protein
VVGEVRFVPTGFGMTEEIDGLHLSPFDKWGLTGNLAGGGKVGKACSEDDGGRSGTLGRCYLAADAPGFPLHGPI